MHSLAGEVEYAVVGADGEDIDAFSTIRAAKACKARVGGGCRVVPRIVDVPTT